MTPLMTYLAGFGLASAAGAKAFIPVLLLGGLHYTKYVELSESFRWIADPAVMVVLGILVILIALARKSKRVRTETLNPATIKMTSMNQLLLDVTTAMTL